MRGQVSLEYILILAFTLAILIPGVYFFYNYALGQTSGVGGQQFAKLGQEMLRTAEQARSQGTGSWLTLDLNFPDTLEDVNVSAAGGELVITYRTQHGPSAAVFFSDVNLSRVLGSRQDGSVFGAGPHPGRASLRFTAAQGWVAIEERYT